MKIAQLYRIEDGNLAGTEIEIVMGLLTVKYPHRKTKDAYVPPMKSEDKEVNTFHCCQADCKQPDFDGGTETLLAHIELHAGRLFKRLKPVTKSHPARIIVELPQNPWAENDNRGVNPERRIAVQLYIGTLQEALRKQGIGIKGNA